MFLFVMRLFLVMVIFLLYLGFGEKMFFLWKEGMRNLNFFIRVCGILKIYFLLNFGVMLVLFSLNKFMNFNIGIGRKFLKVCMMYVLMMFLRNFRNCLFIRWFLIFIEYFKFMFVIDLFVLFILSFVNCIDDFKIMDSVICMEDEMKIMIICWVYNSGFCNL